MAPVAFLSGRRSLATRFQTASKSVCVDPLRRLIQNLKVAEDGILERTRGKTRAAISQWPGFVENGIADQRAQRAANHDLARCPSGRSKSAARLAGNQDVVSPVTSIRRQEVHIARFHPAVCLRSACGNATDRVRR